MKTINHVEASEVIKNLEDGKFFTVVFTKRTTGEERVMNCRQRVKKFLKGGEAKYSFSEKKLVSVFDVQKNEYRCFPLDALKEIRSGGEVFQVMA